MIVAARPPVSSWPLLGLPVPDGVAGGARQPRLGAHSADSHHTLTDGLRAQDLAADTSVGATRSLFLTVPDSRRRVDVLSLPPRAFRDTEDLFPWIYDADPVAM